MKLTDIWPTLGKREPTKPRRNRSATKKGPGRRHANGCERARRDPRAPWALAATYLAAAAIAKAEGRS